MASFGGHGTGRPDGYAADVSAHDGYKVDVDVLESIKPLNVFLVALDVSLAVPDEWRLLSDGLRRINPLLAPRILDRMTLAVLFGESIIRLHSTIFPSFYRSFQENAHYLKSAASA